MEKEVDVLVVGGGITGLSIAAKLTDLNHSVLLLERDNRFGGQIQTVNEQGFTFELGPNTGTISEPEVVELFNWAKCPILTAQAASKNRLVWKKHKFYPLPNGLIPAITTPLFTWSDKLRILGEPWRRKGKNPDESVGELTCRRLGKSFLNYAVDPFIGGIYAGDPHRLVTRHALPKLYYLEAKHGSFIRGTIAKAKAKKHSTARDKLATKEIFSAPGGLTTLINHLVEQIRTQARIKKISSELQTNVQITSIRYGGPYRWEISYKFINPPENVQAKQATNSHSNNTYTVRCKHLVTTVRADLLRSVLPDQLSTDNSEIFAAIENLQYAPVTEVTVGFQHLPQIPYQAFGALVPFCENRQILGILYPGACFPDRLPRPDSRLFTIFVGGARNAQLFTKHSAQEVEAIALKELYDMLKIDPQIQPNLVRTTHYPRAIAQYGVDCEARFAALDALGHKYPGITVAGAVRDGIGLAHRITQGTKLAQSLHDHLLSKNPE